MRKKSGFLLGIMMLASIICGVLTGCGGGNYAFRLAQENPRMEFGQSVSVPLVEVVDGEEIKPFEITISVKDPDGEPVTVAYNKVMATKLGNYTFTYECEEANLEPFILTVPCTDTKAPTITMKTNLDDFNTVVGETCETLDYTLNDPSGIDETKTKETLTSPSGKNVDISSNDTFKVEEKGDYVFTVHAVDKVGNDTDYVYKIPADGKFFDEDLTGRDLAVFDSEEYLENISACKVPVWNDCELNASILPAFRDAQGVLKLAADEKKPMSSAAIQLGKNISMSEVGQIYLRVYIETYDETENKDAADLAKGRIVVFSTSGGNDTDHVPFENLPVNQWNTLVIAQNFKIFTNKAGDFTGVQLGFNRVKEVVDADGKTTLEKHIKAVYVDTISYSEKQAVFTDSALTGEDERRVATFDSDDYLSNVMDSKVMSWQNGQFAKSIVANGAEGVVTGIDGKALRLISPENAVHAAGWIYTGKSIPLKDIRKIKFRIYFKTADGQENGRIVFFGPNEKFDTKHTAIENLPTNKWITVEIAGTDLNKLMDNDANFSNFQFGLDPQKIQEIYFDTISVELESDPVDETFTDDSLTGTDLAMFNRQEYVGNVKEGTVNIWKDGYFSVAIENKDGVEALKLQTDPESMRNFTLAQLVFGRSVEAAEAKALVLKVYIAARGDSAGRIVFFGPNEKSEEGPVLVYDYVQTGVWLEIVIPSANLGVVTDAEGNLSSFQIGTHPDRVDAIYIASVSYVGVDEPEPTVPDAYIDRSLEGNLLADFGEEDYERNLRKGTTNIRSENMPEAIWLESYSDADDKTESGVLRLNLKPSIPGNTFSQGTLLFGRSLSAENVIGIKLRILVLGAARYPGDVSGAPIITLYRMGNVNPDIEYHTIEGLPVNKWQDVVLTGAQKDIFIGEDGYIAGVQIGDNFARTQSILISEISVVMQGDEDSLVSFRDDGGVKVEKGTVFGWSANLPAAEYGDIGGVTGALKLTLTQGAPEFATLNAGKVTLSRAISLENVRAVRLRLYVVPRAEGESKVNIWPFAASGEPGQDGNVVTAESATSKEYKENAWFDFWLRGSAIDKVKDAEGKFSGFQIGGDYGKTAEIWLDEAEVLYETATPESILFETDENSGAWFSAGTTNIWNNGHLAPEYIADEIGGISGVLKLTTVKGGDTTHIQSTITLPQNVSAKNLKEVRLRIYLELAPGQTSNLSIWKKNNTNPDVGFAGIAVQPDRTWVTVVLDGGSLETLTYEDGLVNCFQISMGGDNVVAMYLDYIEFVYHAPVAEEA